MVLPQLEPYMEYGWVKQLRLIGPDEDWAPTESSGPLRGSAGVMQKSGWNEHQSAGSQLTGTLTRAACEARNPIKRIQTQRKVI